MTEKVGLIGVGAIGMPAATNMMAAGFEVHGYRRSSLDAFVDAGGVAATSPRAVAEACDVIISCVNTAEAAEELITGEEGILSAKREGLIIIEMNTINVTHKERFKTSVEAAGCTLLDSPILGVPAAVMAKKAIIFVSGDEQAYQRTKDIYAGITDRVSYVGEFGNGSKMKYVANTLVGVHIAVTGEAMALAKKAGIPQQTVIDMLANSAASSFQFDTRAPMMMERRWLPAMASHTVLGKDLATIKEFADSIGCDLHLLDEACAYYQRSLAEGRAEEDCGSIYDIILANCGVDPEASDAS